MTFYVKDPFSLDDECILTKTLKSNEELESLTVAEDLSDIDRAVYILQHKAWNFGGRGQLIRSSPVCNWYLIYQPRKDKRQSQPRWAPVL
ncbi:uncharacterized protein LOC118767303 [Octopus sinensis]|uniref:Uncharacterized protein LOC118767303 n=1 Tax=Octopus sinensis TaxID=2607531 RepID=A0A7E6FL14_9MOLL|nr:uncharacterized protein LOC118767303 [Octopus sinensis]